MKNLADYLIIPDSCDYVTGGVGPGPNAVFPCGLLVIRSIAIAKIDENLGRLVNNAHLLHHMICPTPKSGWWDIFLERENRPDQNINWGFSDWVTVKCGCK